MYNNLSELLTFSEDNGWPLWKTVLDGEMCHSGRTESEIFSKLGERYAVMRGAAEKALEKPLAIENGLIEGLASAQNAYAASGNTISGTLINTIMARALSCSETNASMGLICAAPTAGACGVLPAVLMTLSEKYALSERATLEALLVASGVGAVITQNASISGAEAGCQAECGAAASMAAAAAVYMAGGSARMSIHASSFALINCMGLICDPIAGLVQMPCAQRNASQAVSAVLSADLALAGMRCVIPADEVLEAMLRTGKQLPAQLKETALGGLAATATGKKLAKMFDPGGGGIA